MTAPGTLPPMPKALVPRSVPALLARVVINAAVPVLAYLLLRPHLRSEITALVIAAAIPAAYTAGVLLWRRRLDPVGVIAIGGFAIGLLVLAATGSEVAFKLREDIWTGPLGLACLISAAVRRPLLFSALQLAGRRNPEIAERIGNPGAGRTTAVVTVIIGAILVAHALAMVVLALTTSTATFLTLSRPISWAIVVGGLAGLMWWIRRQRLRWPDQPARQDTATGELPDERRQ